MERASDFYHESLSQEAEEYLVEERGFLPQTINQFQLGYVADPLPGHESVRGYLSIPYMTPDDSVVSIRFRRLGDEATGPKYRSIAGDKPRPFNTKALELPEPTGMIITEGEFDAMSAVQMGFPAVGVPGAETWQKMWRRLFVQYSVVYVLRDDDEAGKDLANKICGDMENAREIPMKNYGDVNGFMRKVGPDGFKKLFQRK